MYQFVLIFRQMYLDTVSEATSMEFAAIISAMMYVCTCVSSNVNKL